MALQADRQYMAISKRQKASRARLKPKSKDARVLFDDDDRGKGDRREPYVLDDDDAGYRSRGSRGEGRQYWRGDRGQGPRRGR